jgi:MFS family permease
MCGSVAYGLAQRPAGVLVAALLLGLGVGGNAAWFTMLAESVDDELRPVVFGANLMMVNIALGLGGLVGGIALQSSGPAGFRVLYVANALTFVLAAALLWRLREPGGTPANASTRARQLRGSEPGSRLAVLRTPGLVPVLALSVAAFLAGYSQLEVAVPGVMLKQGLGTVHVAAAFTVNTVVVVIGQFLLLPRLRHRPPLANVVGFALLWSLGWCALAAVTLSDMVALSTVLGSLCLGLFALGECLYAVTLPTMVNALATDANRGMVNGLYTMATSVGFFAGPLVSGQIFVVAGPRSLAVALAVGCGAIAAVAVIVGARASRAVALEPVYV